MPLGRILVVEDDAAIRRGLADALKFSGYITFEAPDGRAGLDAALSADIDLVLLDILMPRMDGFAVLVEIRKAKPALPVIFLTAKGEETDRVRGLRTGADDYVVKPFGLMELLERVRALLRRSRPAAPPAAPERLAAGDLSLDPARFEVLQAGHRLELSPKEFLLLKLLVSRAGQVVTREVLFDEVWGYEKIPNTRTLDNHILRLRQKLGDDPENPRYIRTVHGIGYRFET